MLTCYLTVAIVLWFLIVTTDERKGR